MRWAHYIVKQSLPACIIKNVVLAQKYLPLGYVSQTLYFTLFQTLDLDMGMNTNTLFSAKCIKIFKIFPSLSLTFEDVSILQTFRQVQVYSLQVSFQAHDTKCCPSLSRFIQTCPRYSVNTIESIFPHQPIRC